MTHPGAQRKQGNEGSSEEVSDLGERENPLSRSRRDVSGRVQWQVSGPHRHGARNRKSCSLLLHMGRKNHAEWGRKKQHRAASGTGPGCNSRVPRGEGSTLEEEGEEGEHEEGEREEGEQEEGEREEGDGEDGERGSRSGSWEKAAVLVPVTRGRASPERACLAVDQGPMPCRVLTRRGPGAQSQSQPWAQPGVARTNRRRLTT